MAVESTQRSAVALKLDAGTGAGGRTIVKSCSLGKVLAGANADKVMAVTGLLLPVLAYPLVRVERIQVSTIENG